MSRENTGVTGRSSHKRNQSKGLDPPLLSDGTPLRTVPPEKNGLNLFLLGKIRAGKSSTGNTILGRQAFISKKSYKSVTQDVAVESGSFNELPVTVHDTPGLSDIDSEEEIQQMINEKILQICESGLCVFLLVIKADRFTEGDRKTVEKIEKILGQKHLKNTWILFTRGDELEDENTTIKEFIDDNEELKALVQKYDHRYHVFNNKKKGPSKQVATLLTKILKHYLDIMAGGETLESNPLRRTIPEYVAADTRVSSLTPRRIVLVGKSGVGKSAAGNTILGQREFSSMLSLNLVTTASLVAHATVLGRSVSVVDTPGLFDTLMNPEELVKEIARSIYLSSPGPHAFLIVFLVNMRFTEQEQQIPQLIEMIFGQEVLKYSIILFTHGDQLEGTTVEKLILENSRLRALVQKCGGRYQLFNNRDQNNREQVNDLLQKIDSMVQKNGGGHYTNQMYEDAYRFIPKKEEERRREVDESWREIEERQREIEERQRKIEERQRKIEERQREIEEEEEETERKETERNRKDTERNRGERRGETERNRGEMERNRGGRRREYEKNSRETERNSGEMEKNRGETESGREILERWRKIAERWRKLEERWRKIAERWRKIEERWREIEERQREIVKRLTEEEEREQQEEKQKGEFERIRKETQDKCICS